MLPYTKKNIDNVEFDLQKLDNKHYLYIKGDFNDVFCDKHKYLKFLKSKKLKKHIKKEIKDVFDNYDNVNPIYIIPDVEPQYHPFKIHNQSFQKMSKKEKTGLGMICGGTALLLSVFYYLPLSWFLTPLGIITTMVGRKMQTLSKTARQLNSEEYMIRINNQSYNI